MKAPLASLLVAAALVSPSPGKTRFQTIYSFTDGYPVAMSRVKGVLYGAFNGFQSCGFIFSLEPSAGNSAGAPWNETVLYDFRGGGDACGPTIAPVPGPGGGIYGLAGGLYELQPPAAPDGAWTETFLLSQGTYGGLVNGPARSFYALADKLLQLSPPSAPGGSWTETDLFAFPQTGSGALAPTSLIAGPSGVLYGTAPLGGNASAHYGAVFQLTPPTAAGDSWTLQILHSFGQSPDDAGDPLAVTLASDGALYGVTCATSPTCDYVEDGTEGRSVVFRLKPPASAGGDWTYSVLAGFHILRNGGSLDSPLLLRRGRLYGAYASAFGGGVFELRPPSTPGGSWTRKDLHRFTNGQTPFGTIVMDEHGVLYGATGSLYNDSNTGTVYSIDTR